MGVGGGGEDGSGRGGRRFGFVYNILICYLFPIYTTTCGPG